MIYTTCGECGHALLRCQHYFKGRRREEYAPRQCRSAALSFGIHCFKHASPKEKKRAKTERAIARKTKAP